MIKGSTKLFGIFGNPIEHTLSPFIHNTLAEIIDEDSVYTAFHVSDEPGKAAEGAFAMGVEGLNITVPFKQDIMKSLVDIDRTAEAIGAVNTLVRAENGYKGYNTDVYGIKRALDESLDISGHDAVILGAGGAARAVVYMCMESGCAKVYIVNRTIEKAKALADEMNRKFSAMTSTSDSASAMTSTSVAIPVAVSDISTIDSEQFVLIQCTSLGLKPGDGLLVDDDSFYEKAAFGYDLIYNPKDTPFTKKLAEIGIAGDNGLSMLLYQAVKSHELWTGREIPEEAVRKTYAALRKKVYGDNIVLTGFMGSGKSSVGRELAAITGMHFLDMDAEIVRETGLSINEIFSKYGEEEFRKLEHNMLVSFSDELYGTIVSTGGGVVVREDNIPYLKELGKVVYLDASDETVYERVKDDTGRPLLKDCDRETALKRIADLKSGRLVKYGRALDICIYTDDKSASDIAREIVSRIQSLT